MTVTLNDIKSIAERLRDKLSEYEGFKGLYVYGSRVNGNPEPDSDLDMVAVFEKSLPYEISKQITWEVIKLEHETDLFIEMLRMTEEGLKINTTFFEEIKKGLYYAAR